ncbi:PREDICTED: ficolin-1-like isoform X1 [Amphimedon queenslandica]|uniref:Fibrinogen C-terminal domain-containing protein n=1 Tax=Amphimedon queenslandica TaxID=400682 RepID=A0A1X7TF57_AMPQE|nr:PREDICTED: ficolin-1-like isoform X1 [Amphimedon queenslandica]|eukprot:XP_019859952.1 PREDICTED: ficolin-1-like isoform X1 [Amphimedon queenslandica]
MSYWFLLVSWFILVIVTGQSSSACIRRDCKELYDAGYRCSGVYKVKPDELPAFEVYCDMSKGGGWTVFQRRMDGSVNFYLNWADYVKGFGDLNGEFWLGLNKINRLTARNPSFLRIELEDFAGIKKYAYYHTFGVGNAASKYKLTVTGYKGTAGDSLSYHNGMKFSTRDQDNDLGRSEDCAKRYKGAWWYKHCHQSNLNGLYLVGSHSSYANGVNWYHFKRYHYSLKTSQMMLRRR